MPSPNRVWMSNFPRRSVAGSPDDGCEEDVVVRKKSRSAAGLTHAHRRASEKLFALVENALKNV